MEVSDGALDSCDAGLQYKLESLGQFGRSHAERRLRKAGFTIVRGLRYLVVGWGYLVTMYN